MSPFGSDTASPGTLAVTEDEGDLDGALQVFLAHRTRLFRIAYRVTGDVSHAEDVVQETWVRWQRTDRSEVRNSAAFLTTAATHLAINLIQTARHRHETPAEPPLIDLVDVAQDPASRLEQEVAVRESLDLMLRRLTRAELTAYLLRKGFDYAYADLARLLRTTVPNTRQLVRRAQLRLDAGMDRSVDRRELPALVSAFLRAASHGELEQLERLLCGGLPTPCAGGRRPAHAAHRPALPRTA
jgi:RNA polymerase sigma factor (sigma-70 family)